MLFLINQGQVAKVNGLKCKYQNTSIILTDRLHYILIKIIVFNKLRLSCKNKRTKVQIPKYEYRTDSLQNFQCFGFNNTI